MVHLGACKQIINVFGSHLIREHLPRCLISTCRVFLVNPQIVLNGTPVALAASLREIPFLPYLYPAQPLPWCTWHYLSTVCRCEPFFKSRDSTISLHSHYFTPIQQDMWLHHTYSKLYWLEISLKWVHNLMGNRKACIFQQVSCSRIPA